MKNTSFPGHLSYSRDHLWLEPGGHEARIGITAFAAQGMGEVSFVNIPVKGMFFRPGEVFGTIEAARMYSSLHMPVSGIILEVNPKLAHAPGLVSLDPYGEGWLACIVPTHAYEIAVLLDAMTLKNLAGR